jgi:hypothetical protein
MGLSVDSRLKDLVSDERALAILHKHLPQHKGNPEAQQVMYYTLREIAMYPEAGITPDKLKAIDEDLRAL